MNFQSAFLILAEKISLCYRYVWQIFMSHSQKATPLGSTHTIFNSYCDQYQQDKHVSCEMEATLVWFKNVLW